MKPSKVVVLRTDLGATELLTRRLGKDSARSRLGRAVHAYLMALDPEGAARVERALLTGGSLALEVVLNSTG
jgi:hypothetical protein